MSLIIRATQGHASSFFCARISAAYKNAIKFLHGFPNSLMVHELLNAGMRRMYGSA